MSVRHCLLAILEQGPCYGYQLRTEFNRRTGSLWPLNVGQVYNTLERLERDGLVARAGADEQGHVFYRITDDGRADVRAWLDSPVVRVPARDELTVKLAMIATLPGVDLADAMATQRSAAEHRLRLLRSAQRRVEDASDSIEVAGILAFDAQVFHAEAEVRWLEHIACLLERASTDAGSPVPLDSTPVKRGRPARSPLSPPSEVGPATP